VPLIPDDEDEQRPHDLIVTLGTHRYGIPVEQVREVIRPGTMTRVPGAPVMVRGIVNVRGAVVTVLDLQSLLTGERAVTVGSIVLLEHGTRLVGLAVHTVRDVRAAGGAEGLATEGPTDGEVVVPLDAAALCARHLLSSEETGQ
jgi:purine-binding chemotaxis protein CheW